MYIYNKMISKNIKRKKLKLYVSTIFLYLYFKNNSSLPPNMYRYIVLFSIFENFYLMI